MNRCVLLSALFGAALGELLDARVDCEGAEIKAFLSFDRAFDGVVFAKGFYEQDACRIYGLGRHQIILVLPANQNPQNQPFCGVYSINNVKMVHVVVSAVHNIIVEGSREIEFQCQYQLGPMTLRVPFGGLKINWPAAEEENSVVISASHDADFPTLKMLVRDGHGIEGHGIRNANVGQQITLDVFYKTGKTDLLVHDCLGHDGTLHQLNGEKRTAVARLIDNSGCVTLNPSITDRQVQIVHGPDGYKHIYLTLYGFQFYTTDLVHFECQIKPCPAPCPQPLQLCSITTPANPFRPEPPEELPPLNGTHKRSLNKVVTAVLGMRKAHFLRTRDDPIVQEKTVIENPPGHVCVPLAWMLACLVLMFLGCLVCSALLVWFWIKLKKETAGTQEDTSRFPSLSSLS